MTTHHRPPPPRRFMDGTPASSLSLSSSALRMSTLRTAAMATTAVATVAGTAFVKLVLDRPSRTYNNETVNENTVAQEYDAWADDGILEYYWGEHIHLGYYSKQDIERGIRKRTLFKQSMILLMK